MGYVSFREGMQIFFLVILAHQGLLNICAIWDVLPLAIFGKKGGMTWDESVINYSKEIEWTEFD